jgi:hypothetical protein
MDPFADLNGINWIMDGDRWADLRAEIEKGEKILVPATLFESGVKYAFVGGNPVTDQGTLGDRQCLVKAVQSVVGLPTDIKVVTPSWVQAAAYDFQTDYLDEAGDDHGIKLVDCHELASLPVCVLLSEYTDALVIWTYADVEKVYGWYLDLVCAELEREESYKRSVDFSASDEDPELDHDDHDDHHKLEGDPYSRFCFDFLWTLMQDGHSASNCVGVIKP